MTREIVGALALIALSGCGGPSLSERQKEQVREIAEDFADASVSSTTTSVEIAGLKNEISDLKLKVDSLEKEVAFLRKENLEDANAAAELERRINKLRNGN